MNRKDSTSKETLSAEEILNLTEARPFEPTTSAANPARDGTIYLGISPETDRPLYAMPYDIDGFHSWYEAEELASQQSFGGHGDWRLPTKAELNLLYARRDDLGLIHRRDRDAYWSLTGNDRFGGRDGNAAWALRFNDGSKSTYFKVGNYRVRCVRSS